MATWKTVGTNEAHSEQSQVITYIQNQHNVSNRPIFQHHFSTRTKQSRPNEAQRKKITFSTSPSRYWHRYETKQLKNPQENWSAIDFGLRISITIKNVRGALKIRYRRTLITLYSFFKTQKSTLHFQTRNQTYQWSFSAAPRAQEMFTKGRRAASISEKELTYEWDCMPEYMSTCMSRSTCRK